MSQLSLTEQSLVEQIATLALEQIYSGGKVSQNEIHKKLNISRHMVKKVMSSSEYAQYLEEINREASSNAVAAIKGRVEILAPKALKALEHNLDEKRMDAVNTYFKLLGILEPKNEDKPVDTAIQIILPGQAAPKDIEVEASDAETK